MLKRFFKSEAGLFILSLIASLYIRLVYFTSRWQLKNFHIPQRYLKSNTPFLTCFWHERLLMLPYGWVGRKARPQSPFFMLISGHSDGRLISKTVGWFGIKTIAGSTNRGGRAALLEILRTFKAGHVVGITPDGPRGPRHSVSPGTVKIAEMGKIDLLPITFSTSRAKIFKSWDRFFLPLPFSRGVIQWGSPVNIEGLSESQAQERIQEALESLRKEADQAAGR